MFKIQITKVVEKDYKKLQSSGDKTSLNNLKKIMEEISINPYIGTGRPKKLVGNLSGKYSRRLNKKNRIVYEVDEEKQIVTIFSLIEHYSDN